MPILATLIPFAALVLVGGSTVRGQSTTLAPEFGDLFVPDFNVDHVAYIQSALELTEHQSVIVQTLLADYEQDFLAGAGDVRRDLTELRPLQEDLTADHHRQQQRLRQDLARALSEAQKQLASPDVLTSIEDVKEQLGRQFDAHQDATRGLAPPPLTPDEMQQIGQAMLARIEFWGTRREEYRLSFEQNLFAILDDVQIERWTGVSRALRRSRELADIRLSGEGADLVAAFASVGAIIEDTPELDATMQRYETELDAMLIQRRQLLRQGNLEMFRAQISADRTRMTMLFDRELAARLAIRDFNDRSAQTIAKSIAGEAAPVFLMAAYQAGYPRVQRSTRVGRILEAAPALPDLDTLTTRRLEDLRAAYEGELAEVTARIRNEVRANEPAIARQRMAQHYTIALEPLETDPGQPIREAYAGRTTLDRVYFRRLKELVTDDQLRSITP